MVKPNGAVLFAPKIQVNILKLLLDKADRVHLLLNFWGSKDILGRVKGDAGKWRLAQGDLKNLLEVVKDVESKNLSSPQSSD